MARRDQISFDFPGASFAPSPLRHHGHIYIRGSSKILKGLGAEFAPGKSKEIWSRLTMSWSKPCWIIITTEAGEAAEVVAQEILRRTSELGGLQDITVGGSFRARSSHRKGGGDSEKCLGSAGFQSIKLQSATSQLKVKEDAPRPGGPLPNRS